MSPERLFFAVWPDVELRRRLSALARLIPTGARRVPERNLHLTLIFLGAVERTRREDIVRVADRVRTAPFSLAIDRVGCWRNGGIAWVGPAVTPPALTALVTALNDGLAPQGFLPDPRSYHPHITLARDVTAMEPQVRVEPTEWSVQSFSLVASHTRSAGSGYDVLQSWPLCAPVS